MKYYRLLKYFVFSFSILFSVVCFPDENVSHSLNFGEAIKAVGSCDVLLENYPVVMVSVVKEAVRRAVTADFLYAATRKNLSSIERYFIEINDYYKKGALSDFTLSPNEKMLASLNEMTASERRVARDYEGGSFVDDNSNRNLIDFLQKDDHAWRYWFCEVASAHAGLGGYKDEYRNVIEFIKDRPVDGYFGDLNVHINTCEVKSHLGLRNKNHEPENWNGSRFYEVDISVKNMARESKRPRTGSVYIVSDGVEYEYDTVVPVFADGYNFGSGRLNPLLTARSKIVYRIPNDVDGEAFWGPGGGAPWERLWCGHIKSF